jgi:hypothetical protein
MFSTTVGLKKCSYGYLDISECQLVKSANREKMKFKTTGSDNVKGCQEGTHNSQFSNMLFDCDTLTGKIENSNFWLFACC